MCNISSEFIDAVKEWASTIAEIKSVILFGSRAKGTEAASSDWDICIEVQGSPLNSWYGIWVDEADDWKCGFCKATGVGESEVQFVSFTSEAVKNGVKECSKYLYQK